MLICSEMAGWMLRIGSLILKLYEAFPGFLQLTDLKKFVIRSLNPLTTNVPIIYKPVDGNIGR